VLQRQHPDYQFGPFLMLGYWSVQICDAIGLAHDAQAHQIAVTPMQSL